MPPGFIPRQRFQLLAALEARINVQRHAGLFSFSQIVVDQPLQLSRVTVRGGCEHDGSCRSSVIGCQKSFVDQASRSDRLLPLPSGIFVRRGEGRSMSWAVTKVV